jgi:hypothetical protein
VNFSFTRAKPASPIAWRRGWSLMSATIASAIAA